MYLIKPKKYKPVLNLKQTELAIEQIKNFFQLNLASELFLRRVTAPLFVLKGLGINDDLNGTERAVTFPIKDIGDQKAEIVHSLAKWKRLMLAELKIRAGYGLYTDMNAIRADEELGNLHSLYVDQWDWEKTITAKDRSVKYLKETVRKIYDAMKRTEFMVFEQYPKIKPVLPKDIFFIHADELRAKYPSLTPKERENKIVKEKGAVFIMSVGATLSDGTKHDTRAPDYDDWNLNGDILVYNPVLDNALELSSMGIRVDKESLLSQLKAAKAEDRKKLYFHDKLLKGELPLSIGGGIGQSRLCLFFLRKAHIGEVQASVWPEKMLKECKKLNIEII